LYWFTGEEVISFDFEITINKFEVYKRFEDKRNDFITAVKSSEPFEMISVNTFRNFVI